MKLAPDGQSHNFVYTPVGTIVMGTGQLVPETAFLVTGKSAMMLLVFANSAAVRLLSPFIPHRLC